MEYATKTIFAARDKKGAIEAAAQEIKNGGIVVFPTETVYGLGADAKNSAAVDKIFIAKGRPQDNPLIVHIADVSQLDEIVKNVNEKAQKLMDAFWPGPLSIIFEKMDCIPNNVSAGLKTIAVRMPKNEIAREIIRKSGRPIAAPSANTSGKPSPTQAKHAYEDLCGRVPLIIDGGICEVGVESTVVDVTGEVPVILRPGDITIEMMEKVVGAVRLHSSITSGQLLKKDAQPSAPGMKYKHYSPNAQVIVFDGDKIEVEKSIKCMYDLYRAKGKSAEVVCLEECAAQYAQCNVAVIGKNAKQAAAALFTTLRDADELKIDIILFHMQEKMGLAVKNRIIKAAGNQVITVKEEKID
ncbi:MAG: L-threonylcarbamoyladenylate synthase [Christensenellaceae bacterium]